jgi:hypothetical protein
LHKFLKRIDALIAWGFQMKNGRGGIATTAIVAIVVAVVVVAAVVAVFLLKPGAEVSPTPTGQVTSTPSGQVTPTPTEQPTQTPTAQATPTPAGEVIPKPGATLIGPIEISRNASSGIINFTVSENGDSLTSVSITLYDLECEGPMPFSVGSYTAESLGAFPVTNGAFTASISGTGEIEGQFTSPTEASGTINLIVEIPSPTRTFEFGTFNWSAQAE